ncbi:MAG: glycoside hydrolase family 125 protein [Armatimonadota bacterium]|nr:glycoside hydrolase family 125 protein [bacterium]
MSISYRHLNTGNEYVSLPGISTATAGIERVGFVHEGFRGVVEIHGAENCPLLKPTVQVDGDELFEEQTQAELISYWIPRFRVSSPRITATSLVVAPIERRGYVSVLTIENTSDHDVTVKAGWKGCWKSCFHTANLSKQMLGAKYAYISNWKPGVPIVEYRGNTPLFAFALLSPDISTAKIVGQENITEGSGDYVKAGVDVPVYYEVTDEYVLQPGETRHMPMYIGLGMEEVSAIASAEELRLQTWDRLLANLKSWLDKHIIECDDPHFKRVMNINSFYNYFYSQAIALDTEELVISTSRSSSNDWCAAYWDRDAMRWSLPAVLQINWAQARKMLIYAFTKQLPNVGMHSRFINGKVLQPGFQLDQLCAPIRALDLYVDLTGDMSVLFDRRVQGGVNTIQQILAAQRHPEVALFETLLLPSGAPSRLPYECFSNMLVWRVLLDVARIYDRIRDIDRSDDAKRLAISVKNAITEHFIVEGPFGRMFARSVDLQGEYEMGDDPAGSLQLMTYFGFCTPNDPVYKNTVQWIHSEHNPHSGCEGSSLLSVVNDLLTGRKEQALDFLRRAGLDDGIACESVDCETGQAISGLAFASCAGYLAFGLRYALNALCPPTALVDEKRRPSETLYQPPPEMSHDTRKARM